MGRPGTVSANASHDSARVRIKARFHPEPRPLALFYPPKWGINDRIPAAARSTAVGQVLLSESEHLPLAA